MGVTLFIAGCTANDNSGANEGFPSQLRQSLARIKAIMEADGQTLNDMVNLTTFVVHINSWTKNRTEVGSIFEEMFKEIWSKLRHPCIGVA